MKWALKEAGGGAKCWKVRIVQCCKARPGIYLALAAIYLKRARAPKNAA